MKLDRWSGGEAKGAGGRTRDSGKPARAPTPIFVPPRVMAIIVVLGTAALAYVLYAAPSILIVALGGTALAILLSFPVRALQQVMPRGLAILVTFLGMLGLVTLALSSWSRCSSGSSGTLYSSRPPSRTTPTISCSA